MPLTKTEEKYINLTLSDLLERAMTYKKLSESKTRSTRDRAIWRAIFIDSARAYNTALMTLGFLATTKLAIEKKPVTDALFKGDGFDLLSEIEVTALITELYEITDLQKKIERERLNREHAQILAFTTNATKQVREALLVLSKHKALNKFVDVDKLMTIAPPDIKALPRGNTIPRAEDSESNTLSEIEAAIAKVEINNSPEDGSIAQKSKLLSILED